MTFICYRNGIYLVDEDTIEDAKVARATDIHDREVCGQRPGIYEIKSSNGFGVRLYLDATTMTPEKRKSLCN